MRKALVSGGITFDEKYMEEALFHKFSRDNNGNTVAVVELKNGFVIEVPLNRFKFKYKPDCPKIRFHSVESCESHYNCNGCNY